MIKLFKKLIVPFIIVCLFAALYFLIIMPYAKRRIAKENVFKNFEQSMTNLKIKYKKTEIDAEEFGAWKAYSYVSDNKKVTLYVFNKDSKKYNDGVKNGYISSSSNAENKLYAVFNGNCALYMEAEFPHDSDLLNLFMTFSNDYMNTIKS